MSLLKDLADEMSGLNERYSREVASWDFYMRAPGKETLRRLAGV